ncbi:MAG: restriction endonuclease subunit S [Gammaproteobacteria bacterium]|nr:restriction endonuclease subunit S [Gammaproteobacteria bacterium]
MNTKLSNHDNSDLVRISDIVKLNPETYSAEMGWNKIKYLDTSNITNGRIDEIVGYDAQEDKIPSRAKRVVKNNDLIYSTVRPNQRHYGILRNIPANLLVSTGFSVLRNKFQNKYDIRYIYHLITQENITDYLQGIAENNTSAYPALKPTDLTDLKFSFPPLEYQKAASSFIEYIDNKIELNHKMNQTLEDIAKAIFKSWFVDFDPVRAKIEGRPVGLPQEISDLFPDELVDSEIGEIPKGWMKTTISHISEIQNGYAFKRKDWDLNGQVPVVKIGNVKPMLVDIESCSRIKTKMAKGLERFKLSVGDALIGLTGYVGEVGLVPDIGKVPYLNQRVGKFNPINSDDYCYLVIMTRRSKFKSQVVNLGTGSAQANVSPRDILGISLILPPAELRRMFAQIVSPIIKRILISCSEAHNISKLRDTLLPKLISGELRIPDAEKFLEEAGI